MRPRLFLYFHIPAILIFILLLLMSGCATKDKNWVQGCYYGSYFTLTSLTKSQLDSETSQLVYQSCLSLEEQIRLENKDH